MRSRGIIAGILLCFSSCASYYQKNLKFNTDFASGQIERAKKDLDKSSKEAFKNNRYLYYVNQGVVGQLLGDYRQSNEWFEKAYLFNEDFRKSFLEEGASFLVNDKLKTYTPEDHEQFYVLYYKAVNYIKLAKWDEALVECKRLISLTNVLSDKKKVKNKFREDAFAHVLIGLVYDALRDYNNAFIAYRNALRIYENQYRPLFGIEAPRQLKEDLLRTAYLVGFYEELESYQKKFGMTYVPEDNQQTGELVFLWNNGLGPVKTEWSLDFVIFPGGPGAVMFRNEDLGWAFPFPVGSGDKISLEKLRVVRIALPKYVERPLMFSGANLQAGSLQSDFNLGEDVNIISRKLLSERMFLTVGKTLLRVALKQAASEQIRKKNQGWGVAANLLASFTEQADTRNWQTLPHSIYYTRMRLPEGEQEVQLNLHSDFGSQYNQKRTFKYNIRRGQTQFAAFSSLEVAPYFRSEKLEH
ncbi:MAG: hypothetical protein MI784_16490 [Cytophagales bacterium]|nr:hypothetical protein [Cytophagales bacterium]